MAEKKDTTPIEHEFVPKHELMSEEEVEKVLQELGAKKSEFPKILKKDPAIRHLEVQKGQVIKISRNSETAGKTVYYRMVI